MTPPRFRLTLAAVLALPCADVAHGSERSRYSEEVRSYVAVDSPIVALTGVTLIDGSGAPALTDHTIVIRGSAIVDVGPTDDLVVPDDAEILRLHGHTVIPGLVGMHNHTHMPGLAFSGYSFPRLYLAAGVTTIQTAGSAAPFDELNLAASIARGDTPGPEIVTTGPYFTGPGGSSSMLAPVSEREARRLVREWAGRGVGWLKLYRHVQPGIAAAVIEEAHAHDLKVTGHLCSLTVGEAIALGIDAIEHGLMGKTDLVEGKRVGNCPPDVVAASARSELADTAVEALFRALIESDVAVTSTLAIFETHFRHRPQAGERALRAMAPSLREAYERRQRRLEKGDQPTLYTEATFRKALDYERAFVAAGGRLVAGADPGRHNLPGFGDQRNYELLAEAGFDAVEAVRIMTSAGAAVLGSEHRIGSVAPGLQADLVVLQGDLEAEPATIKRARLVFKGGTGFDPERLIEAVEGQVGLR